MSVCCFHYLGKSVYFKRVLKGDRHWGWSADGETKQGKSNENGQHSVMLVREKTLFIRRICNYSFTSSSVACFASLCVIHLLWGTIEDRNAEDLKDFDQCRCKAYYFCIASIRYCIKREKNPQNSKWWYRSSFCVVYLYSPSHVFVLQGTVLNLTPLACSWSHHACGFDMQDTLFPVFMNDFTFILGVVV